MSLFDRFTKKEDNPWEDAYQADPRIYSKPDGMPFGAFPLTEDTLTVLPKDPRARYQVDGKPIEEWQLALISTTADDMLGFLDFYDAIPKLAQFVIDENDEGDILVKGLSFDEMNILLR